MKPSPRLTLAALALSTAGSAHATMAVIDCTPGGPNDGIALCAGYNPSNPLLPLTGTTESGWTFSLHPTGSRGMFYIDPAIATGYDYTVQTPGVSFGSVQVATLAGDGLYNVFDLTNGSPVLVQGNLATGATFSFVSPVTAFRIDGIETSAALDPLNPLAFVTGISLNYGVNGMPSEVIVTQTPITTGVSSSVPEPATPLLASLGLAGFAAVRRLHRA